MIFVSCNICGSDSYREICNIEVSPVGLGIRSKLVQCKGCGFFYANPRLEMEREMDYYRKQYYEDEGDGHWYEVRADIFKRFLREISKFLKKGKLLDVGCGMGYFMDLARSNGWEVKGIDVSNFAVNHAINKFRLDVSKGSPKDARLETEYFEVVTMWNVLDQLYDPRADLIELNRLLKKEGFLFIRIPNVYFHLTLLKFYNRCKFLFKNVKITPSVFHLYSFDKNSIKKLLEATGFSRVIVRVEPISINNSYIIGTFNRKKERIIRILFNLAANIIYFLTLKKIIMSPSIFVIAQKDNLI